MKKIKKAKNKERPLVFMTQRCPQRLLQNTQHIISSEVLTFFPQITPKMTRNRRILTQLLTISCLNHIYICFQQTYRVETSNPRQRNKSMYIEENFCKHHAKSPKKSTVFIPLSSDKDEEELVPHQETETKMRGCGRGLGHQSTSIIQLSTINESKHIFCHFHSPFWIFLSVFV